MEQIIRDIFRTETKIILTANQIDLTTKIFLEATPEIGTKAITITIVSKTIELLD